jgi:hypothetical protein
VDYFAARDRGGLIDGADERFFPGDTIERILKRESPMIAF